MIKYISMLVIVAIIAVGILYLAGAMVASNFNIAEWSKELRATIAVISAICVLILLLVGRKSSR